MKPSEQLAREWLQGTIIQLPLGMFTSEIGRVEACVPTLAALLDARWNEAAAAQREADLRASDAFDYASIVPPPDSGAEGA